VWADRTRHIHLGPYFGGRLATRVGTAEIDQYIEERKEDLPENNESCERERTGTINRELAILRAMYNHGAAVNDPPLLFRVPRFLAKLRESDPRSGWLRDTAYDLLQQNCKHAAFALELRKAELLLLKVQDVNLQDRTTTLLPGTTKTTKAERSK
jgi:integrase